MPIDLDTLALWPHQRTAIDMAAEYIQAFREGETSGSALVRMPTGTGKSGIIAVLATAFDEHQTVLVVTPWRMLRDQLARDIRERFWRAIGSEPFRDGVVTVFTPSTAESVLRETEQSKAVLLCTHQTLQTLHSRAHPIHRTLGDRVTLSLIDEGHREPAVSWARAVRGLEQPSVLFSATPYRNDLKLFAVDRQHTSIYTFHDAIDDRFIRNVRFVDRRFEGSPAKFVDSLLEFFHGDFREVCPDVVAPRAIVRCDTAAEVADVAARLRAAGESVIALHETFPAAGDEFRRQSVPSPAEEDATFWVHQYKLLEGIDDPAFALLAMYRPLGNARSLVQQVGRIIRNPQRIPNQVACVLADPEDGQQDHWEGYCAFERENDGPGTTDPLEVFGRFSELQAQHQYFNGAFRERFNPHLPNQADEFAFRLSANAFVVDRQLDLDELLEAVAEEWSILDRFILEQNRPTEHSVFLSYVIHRNAPVLREKAFVEYRLGFTILHREGTYLFCYDSEGVLPEVMRMGDLGKRIPPSRLEHLFSGAAARLSSISLMNTDLGRQSVRRREIHARSVTDTAPGLSDHAHFASTAVGYTESGGGPSVVRRYVGFSNSRISDYRSGEITFDKYIEWLRLVAEELDRDATGARSMFLRYARESDLPPDPTPINILLDVNNVQDLIGFVGGRGPNGEEEAILEDICYDVSRGSFSASISGTDYPISIDYDARRSRYSLASSELDKFLHLRDPRTGEPIRSLTSHLNNEQAFRIVVQGAEKIYAHSQFYEPRIPLGGTAAGRLDLLQILHPVAELAVLKSEKGDKCLPDGSGWMRGCVFELIDRLGSGTELGDHMADVDLLVCDDLGTEVADFIAGDSKNRTLAFIHAKAGTGQKRSAKVFHELSAQAVKNLHYLSPFTDDTPPKYDSWGNPWNNGTDQVVTHRIRRGPRNRRHVWSQLTQIRRDPSARREVWLVLGAGFSRETFRREAQRRSPRGEIVQILYILQSTWSAASSVGANLRLFCSP